MQVSMPKRQHIDLHELQGFDIVLVPFDRSADRPCAPARSARDRRAGHASGRNRRDAGRDGAARPSAAVPASASAQTAVVGIEVQFADAAFADPSLDQDHMPDDSALIMSSGRPSALPTSRMRSLGTIAGDGRAECCLLLPVGLVDPLDDLFAPLVLEVDVDIRRLVALLARRSARTADRSSLDRSR